MKRVIPIRIRDKIAVAPKNAFYVCGNSDYAIRFDFDDEWDGLDPKTARFVYNGQYVEMIFSGNVCPVPIISNTYAFEVGVYAGNLSTTTKAYVPAKKSTLCGAAIPAEPVSVYVPASELEKKLDKSGGKVTGAVQFNNGKASEIVVIYPDGRVQFRSGDEVSINVGIVPVESVNKRKLSFWGGDDQRVELTNIATPTEANSAANKEYVDKAVANAGGGSAATDITDTLMELIEQIPENLPTENAVYYWLGIKLIERFPAGEYVGFCGTRAEIYKDEEYAQVGGIRLWMSDCSVNIIYYTDYGIDVSASGSVRWFSAGNERVEVFSGSADNVRTLEHRIKNLYDPIDATDAANKGYVDDTITAKLNAIGVAEEGSY